MDGMFTSSTSGNMNVLIDYTNCINLIELINNKSKFSIHSIELLCGNSHLQIIPPTITKCKISGTFDNARQFQNNEIFYILDNDQNNKIYQFIQCIIKETQQTQPKKTPRNTFIPVSNDDIKLINTDDDKYLDLK